MSDCHYWMIKHHSRSRISHNRSNFFPHLRLITMHLAIGTESFRLHKRTFITSHPSISIYFRTLSTKLLTTMMLPAIQSYHQGNNLFLLLPLILFRHSTPSFILLICFKPTFCVQFVSKNKKTSILPSNHKKQKPRETLISRGFFWRRERDLNPWYSCPYTRFPGVLLRPLGHLSMCFQRILVYHC